MTSILNCVHFLYCGGHVAKPNGFSHTFPAIRGTQAGRAFYIAMCPLKIIPKIFVFDEAEVPPELRAQRTLNRARIPEIAAYLVDNADSYILSALTASIDAMVEFTPAAPSGPTANMGTLAIPMDARILINDGQHRRAAIEEAIKERSELGQENVPVLFFVDAGLRKSQQMFADLNKYAVRPSTSLGVLYDHRDQLADVARYLADNVKVFKHLTEKERSTISNRSIKLFTLSSIKLATKALLRKNSKAPISDREREVTREYWSIVSEQFPDWQLALRRDASSADLRANYIHSHGIILHALGVAGAELLTRFPKNWQGRIKGLRKINWSRDNTRLWEGRAMVHGRISKAKSNIQATANVILKAYGLPLTPEQKRLERRVA